MSGDGSGTATIWVTKDRGATLVEKGSVPAGETLLRGLRSLADVDTSYGGRFVESVSGISGSRSGQRDWFWFINGLLGDTSAAEYRLHAGDVAWWDIRDWAKDYDTEVVVGAFPEPFLHGYGGHVRPAVVRYGSTLSGPAAGAPADVARSWLRAHGALFGWDGSAVDGLKLVKTLAQPNAGPRTVLFHQLFDGLEGGIPAGRR